MHYLNEVPFQMYAVYYVCPNDTEKQRELQGARCECEARRFAVEKFREHPGEYRGAKIVGSEIFVK